MDDLEPLPPEPWNASDEPWLAPDPNEGLGTVAGTELAANAHNRRLATRSRVFLGGGVIVVLIAAGFVAGTAMGGTPPTVSFTDAATSQASSGPAACGPVFPGSPGRKALTGTVASVDASHSTFAVTAPSGPITVSVSSATRYTKTQSGGPADLSKGAHVLVRGTRAADGAISAQQLVVVPATAAAAPDGSGRAGTGTISASNLTHGAGTLTVAVRGGTKTVNVTTATKVYKTTTASLADVSAGEPVVVAGRSTTSRTVAATIVAIGQSGEASSLAPLGPFGGRGPIGPRGGAFRMPGGPCSATPGSAGRRAAAGTVSNLSGGNFTVTSPRGNVNVTTTSATTYTKQIQELAADIASGSQVLVVGTPSADGTSVAANQIVVSPAPLGAPPKVAPPRFGAAGPGHGVVTGTVAANDKATSTLTVTTSDGNAHKVTYTPTTKVSATVPASLRDVSNGEYVVVTGTSATSGTLTALHVSIGQPGQPTGFGPLGRPGFGRRGPPGARSPAGGSATVPATPATPGGTTNQSSNGSSGTVI